jgi:hypothetical protein
VVRSFAKSPDCVDTRIGSPYRMVRSLGGSDSFDSFDSGMVRVYPMTGWISDRTQSIG